MVLTACITAVAVEAPWCVLCILRACVWVGGCVLGVCQQLEKHLTPQQVQSACVERPSCEKYYNQQPANDPPPVDQCYPCVGVRMCLQLWACLTDLCHVFTSRFAGEEEEEEETTSQSSNR